MDEYRLRNRDSSLPSSNHSSSDRSGNARINKLDVGTPLLLQIPSRLKRQILSRGERHKTRR